jgi:predicted amidophosphoribosyltransferase
MLFTRTLREIIHHLKYSDRVSLAKPLGDLLRQCLEREAFRGETIIPVPLYPARERERGFNQAELIAARLGRPVSTKILRRRKKHCRAKPASREMNANEILRRHSKRNAPSKAR